MNEQDYYDLYGHPPRGATAAAELIVKATNLIGRGIEFIADQFRESGLEDAESAEEVRAYARSIERTQPSFAQDLYAAANRSDYETR